MATLNSITLNGVGYNFANAGGGQPIAVTLASEMTDTSKIYLYLGSETGYNYGYIYAYTNNAWVATTLYGQGEDGADGYSPTASVSSTSTGMTLTVTDKNGTTSASVTNGTATQAQVDAWLDNHPEATTTVEDGSISKVKLASDLKESADLFTASEIEIVLDTVEYESTTYRPLGSITAADMITTENYNPNTGEIVTGLSASARREDTYYMVAPQSTISIPLRMGVIFYDINKNFVSGQWCYNAATLTVPDSAYYIRAYSSQWGYDYFRQITTNVQVNAINISTDVLHTQWDNVDGKDTFVDTVADNVYSIGEIRTAFEISPVFLHGGEFIEVQEGVVYYQHPYPTSGRGDDAQAGVIRSYDAGFNELTHTDKNDKISIAYAYSTTTYRYDLSLRSSPQTYFWFEGNELHGVAGSSGEAVVTYAEQPKYFKVWFDKTFTIGEKFYTQLPTDSVYLNVSDEKAVGFWEQVSEKVEASLETSELLRKIDDSSIRNANRLRHAFRIASWNIYGASKRKTNWSSIKETLQNYGIDVIGFQEVYDPMGRISGTDGVLFSDSLESWHLSQFSDAVSYDGTARIVASTSEFEYVGGTDTLYDTQGNYGNRYLCRTEFKLPRWKGKNWSDYIKVSVYDTQLEVGTSTAYTNVRLAQARQLVEAMQNDPNPFVVLVGDFNEMATDRSTFKVISDAGFTPVLADTSTPTSYRGFYDNIFVNDRISIVNDDVIPFSDNGSGLSDHNLLFADLVFDYSNIIAVKKTGSNCTIGVEDWLDRRITEAVTIEITADDGYTVSNVTVGQGDNDLTYNNGAITVSGNTITVYPNLIVGDMWISVTTTAS